MELNHTSGMTFSTLSVETTDTHTLVRLNRPEIRNAVDQAMVNDLHAVCDELEDDPRVLVVTGCEAEGRNSPKGIFASGADITQLRDRRRANALAGISSRIFDRIATLAMPVIAAVDDLAQAILFESEAKADRMQAVIDRKKKLNMTDTTLPSGLPAHVGVLGGGRMGAGIAHAFLVSGSEVTVVEANPDAADAASRLTVTSDVADFAGCSLVIEAVPEDMGIKTAALESAEVVGTDAWLRTNTSSMSVDELAQAVGEVTGHPERICGLHFFNPVPASKLIEVIIADASAGELRELAPQWVTALGKTPVVVKNRPGFASSRLGLALGLEAMRMVEEGVASVEDIDNAMTLGYKHPVDPLALTDIVGLDVRLGIAEYLSEELGDRFTPPQILRDKVAVGELGRKSGKGFYDYN